MLTSALGAFVVILAAVWFFDTFEQAESQVWVGPSGAARANPYLAAMRFIERMGYGITTIDRPGDLSTLPHGATLILPARRAVVTPERAQLLLRWAASGGHLIIEPEPRRSRDILLEALGVHRAEAGKFKPAATLAVEFDDLERTLHVTPSIRDTLQTTQDKPDCAVADPGGIRLVSFRHGTGRISVVTGFQRFSNRAIGAHDNAELLWRILRFAPAHRAVLVLRPPQIAPLFDWLSAHAMQIGISALVVLLLWLWRVTPRFGPILPGPERARRQLLEHIRACGRFRWARGARESLLAAAREICNGRIARLRPRLAVMGVEERCRELATEVALDADAVAYAFQGVPQAAREFVHMVATLASIHAALSRAPSAARLRKRQQ